MTEQQHKAEVRTEDDLLILVDYANIDFEKVAPNQLVSASVEALGLANGNSQLNVAVRSYGGWYDGGASSEERYSAQRIHADWPAYFALRDTVVRVRTSFAEHVLQDEIVQRQPARVTHTVVERRGKPRPRSRKRDHECGEDCKLKGIRKWFRKKYACPAKECDVIWSQAFFRREQKQVDVHIAVDLLAACFSGRWPAIAVVSDDLDMVPGLLAASGAECDLLTVRIEVSDHYADPELEQRGVRILRFEGN